MRRILASRLGVLLTAPVLAAILLTVPAASALTAGCLVEVLDAKTRTGTYSSCEILGFDFGGFLSTHGLVGWAAVIVMLFLVLLAWLLAVSAIFGVLRARSL